MFEDSALNSDFFRWYNYNTRLSAPLETIQTWLTAWIYKELPRAPFATWPCVGENKVCQSFLTCFVTGRGGNTAREVGIICRFKRKYTQFVQAVLFTVEIVCMCLYSTLTYILVCELQLRRFGNACSQWASLRAVVYSRLAIVSLCRLQRKWWSNWNLFIISIVLWHFRNWVVKGD